MASYCILDRSARRTLLYDPLNDEPMPLRSRRDFLRTAGLSALGAWTWGNRLAAAEGAQPVTRKIFAVSYGCLFGADQQCLLMHHLLERVIGKTNPRICFLAAASGDDRRAIAFWYERMQKFVCVPRHQRVFINSPDYPDWDSEILAADAVFVGGGNTLNMIAIFRAQGLDLVLRRAWEKGVVMSGESAGANCWFQTCSTDSRPGRLSVTDGLGFLPGSMVPHFDNRGRKESTLQFVKEGELGDGYAADDGVAFTFEDDRLTDIVKNRPEARAFRLTRNNGAPLLSPLDAKLLRI